MKALIAALALTLAPAAALAANPPELIGDWKGVVQTEIGPLTILFHVGPDRVTADSPDQGATGLPGTAGTNGSALTLAIPMAQANFEGKLSADGKTLTGVFYQGGNSPSLVLTRISATPTLPPASQPAPAELKGDWTGDAPSPGGPVTITFHLNETPTADIPGQGAGVPLRLEKTADGVKLDLMGIIIAGKLSADGKTIDATMSAQGQSAPIKLTRK